MRDKERLHDYRFLPEPNLPPLRLYTSEMVHDGLDLDQVINVDEVRDSMPELPSQQRLRLQQKYGLSLEKSITIVVGQAPMFCKPQHSVLYNVCCDVFLPFFLPEWAGFAAVLRSSGQQESAQGADIDKSAHEWWAGSAQQTWHHHGSVVSALQFVTFAALSLQNVLWKVFYVL